MRTSNSVSRCNVEAFREWCTRMEAMGATHIIETNNVQWPFAAVRILKTRMYWPEFSDDGESVTGWDGLRIKP